MAVAPLIAHVLTRKRPRPLLARAFNQQGRPSEGYRALRIAERHVAEDVRRRPDIRELVADMAARDRRRALPELHRFSRELGVRP